MNTLPLRPRRSHHRRRALVLAAAVPAAAALAVAVAVRHGRGKPDARGSWNCDCGQAYLVSGVDRHRVYWLPDAQPSDPLLERACVSCGTVLPAGHDAP